MHYSIKLAGLALLAHGTSYTPLAVALVLLGCFEDNIRHWLWLLYLSSNAMTSKPTYMYLAQKKVRHRRRMRAVMVCCTLWPRAVE
jgi:hypothetical protein